MTDRDIVKDIDNTQSVIRHLEEQGFSFEIPERFTSGAVLDKLFPSLGRERDELRSDRFSGIPVETDGLRTALVNRLAERIKNGRPVIHLHADADYLKNANVIGRWLGDLLIRWTAAQVLQNVVEAVPDDIEVYAVRPGHAADEIDVWVFPVKDVGGEIRRKFEKIDISAIVETSTGEKFTFSASIGVVDSNEEILKQFTDDTRQFLKDNPGKLPFDLWKKTYKSCRRKSSFFESNKRAYENSFIYRKDRYYGFDRAM